MKPSSVRSLTKLFAVAVLLAFTTFNVAQISAENNISKVEINNANQSWIASLIEVVFGKQESAEENSIVLLPQNGKIAFTSLRDGNREIYSMNADGTNQTRLTSNAAVDDQPSYSPDGGKIAFASTRDGNYEIYSMNDSGANPIRLTNNSAPDSFPKFSKDNSRIVFVSDRDGNNEIYVMNADGTGQTRLTNIVQVDEYPSFSPDGSKIVFTSLRDGNREIYVMNADGTNQTRLTNNPAVEDQPTFSPDSSKISFSSTRDGNYEVYAMNADGTIPVRLTNNASPDTFPEFSPDGTQIAFISRRDGNDEIYKMNADGTSQTLLSNNATDDQYPSWQPVNAAPFLSINNVTISEPINGTAMATFTVSLLWETANTVFVNVETANSTALAPDDYAPLSVTQLIFNSGETTKQVQVAINSDSLVESDETFFVNLSNATNAVISDAQGVGTIVNGTCAPPVSSLLAWFKGEGNANDSANSFHGATQNGTTFGSGKVGQAFSFDGSNDFVQAGNQAGLRMTNQVSLSAWIHPIGPGGGLHNDGGAIINKEGEYAIGRYPDGKIFWTIANTNPGWVTQNTNYTAPLNQWTHLAFVYDGATAKLYANGTVVHSLAATGAIGDNHASLNELFIGGRQLYTQHFAGQIDEAQIYNAALSANEVQNIYNGGSAGVCPLPSYYQFSTGTLTVGEASSTAAFTVTRTGNLSSPSTVNYATSNGTASGGSDYTTTSGILSFASGETSKTINVLILDDNVYEGSETFSLTLYNPTNSGMLASPNSVGVMINDNDAQPTISINDVAIAEPITGTATIAFNVVLSNPSVQTVTVSAATANNTATGPADFTAVSTTPITFSPGETSKAVNIIVNSDAIEELLETFFVNLSNPSNATITDAQGIGTILSRYSNNGKIAFYTNRDGNNEIYTVSSNGTSPTRLTNNTATDSEPSWSTDGSKIVFGSNRDGNYEIYTMNADGTNQNRLTTAAGIDYDPSFSRDNSRITFISDRDGNYEVYAMDANGANLNRLTNNGVFEYSPSFSPDGTKIAFNSLRDGNSEIYVMNADGTLPTRLTNNAAADASPSWSPDGTKIVFIRAEDVWVMNADGTNQIKINDPTGTTAAGNPSYSPDGTKIIFTIRNTGNQDDLYVMNPDGGSVTQLTNVSGIDEHASWQALDLTPYLSINDITIAEPTSGTATATFTVSLSRAVTNTVTVIAATANNTATEPADYAAVSTTTLTFAPGEMTKQVQVVVNSDASVEPDETFFVNLSNAINAAISDNQGIGTIISSNCASPPSNLVAWYKAENNANDSALANHGSLQHSVTFAPGKIGQAFNLEGTNYVAIPDSPSVSVTGQLSLSAWVKPDTLAHPNTFVAKYNSQASQHSYFFGTNGANGKIQFTLYATNNGTIYRGVVTNNDVVAAGVFSHVAATFNPQTQEIKVYVNGAEVPATLQAGSGTVASIFDSTSPVTIGTYINGTGNAIDLFDGLIDETQIYSRALPQSEIQNIYNAGSVGVCPLPISLQLSAAVYNANENAGSIAIAITRTGSTSSAVTVNYATSNGTATAGSDYTATSGTLNFAAGDTSKTFNVTLLDDSLYEGNETISLTLSNPTGGVTLGTPNTAVLTINENDTAVYSISGRIFASDGTTGLSGITVNLSNGASTTTNATGNYNFANLGAGANYTVTPQNTAIYSFTSQTVTNLQTNQTVNFIATSTEPCNVMGFTNAPDIDLNGNPYAIAVGDFNNDGKKDIVVGNANSNKVSVRLGDGSGNFTAITNVTVDINPYSIAVGDFNNDNNLDFAAANYSSHTVSIRMGDGTGNFSGNTNIPSGGNSPYSIASGDFNNDSKLDLAVANSGTNNVSVRLGDGTGNFSPTTNVSLGTGPFSIALGDFNNDNKLDFVTANYSANMQSSTVSIRLGDGSGNFSGTTDVAVGSVPRSIAVGDLNNDGKLDFAVANSLSNNVSIKLGDGTGNFSGATNIAVGNSPHSIALGDFNGDNKTDFITSNSSSANVSIRLGNGAGSFTGTTNVTVQPSPYSVAIGDFNNDGKSDFATVNVSGTVSIRIGDGLGNFTGTSNIFIGGNSFSVAKGDFNNDGKLDLAVPLNTSPGMVSIRLGDGAGGFTSATNVAIGSISYSIAVGDFNNDNKLDFAAANYQSATVSIRLGDGTGNFSGSINVPVGPGPHDLALGDFNSDNKLDLAVSINSNAVSIRLGDGSGNFAGTTNIAVGASPRSIAIGDFNSDSKLDFAVANIGSNNVSIRLGDGTGNFTGTTNIAVGTSPNSVAIGDFNNDSKPDFAVINGGSNNVSIRLGDGTGNFTGTTNIAVSNSPNTVAIGDFNNDENSDLAIVYAIGVLIKLGDGAGNFTGNTSVEVGNNPNSIILGDFNNDSKLDFATPNSNSSTVSIRLNSCSYNAPPTVSMSSTATNPTTISSIPVTVTFSESVSGFTASDVVVDNGTVSNFSGSGNIYSFNLIPSGSGLVTADIPANVAQDSAGIGNTAAAQFSRTFQCTYALNPNGTNAPAAASMNSFSVTAASGCEWTAVSNNDWLTVSSPANGNGSGNQTVSYSVAANNGVQRTGSITVNGQNFLVTQSAAVYNISGVVSYAITPANQQQKLVLGVQLSVSGSATGSQSSDSTGFYQLGNLSAGGNYTVTPSKTTHRNGITAFDATLVLRCVAAGANCLLTPNQKIAASTDNDPQVTAFDATQILRYVAANGQNANTGQTGNWRFNPVSRPYQNLLDNDSDENYTAFLIGEVDGDWTAPNSLAEAEAEQEGKESVLSALLKAENRSLIIPAPETETLQQEESGSIVKADETEETIASSAGQRAETPGLQLSLPENASVTAGSVVTIPVFLNNQTGKEISSYNFAVLFDPDILQPETTSIETADTLSQHGFVIVTDTNKRGRIGIAALSLNSSVKDSGTLLYLQFKVVGRNKESNNSAIALSFETTKKGTESLFADEFGNRISSAATNGTLFVAGNKSKD